MKRFFYIFTIFIALVIAACEKSSNQASDKFKNPPLPAMEEAMKNKQFLIVIFESENCRYCTKLNKEVLNDLEVKQHLAKNNVKIAIVNVYGKRKVVDPESKNDMNEQILAYVYKVEGFPTIAVFDPKQNYKLLWKITGYLPKDNFIAMIDYLGSGCYNKVPFQKWVENKKTC